MIPTQKQIDDGQVQACLVLSTAHISKRTNDILRDWCKLKAGTYDSIVADYGYGYVFVWIPDEYDFNSEYKVTYMGIPQGCPDLVEVLKYTGRQGYRMLKLDTDGEEIDQLPRFEW